MPIRVLIADDNPETRDNLRKLFTAADDISVVAEAETGNQAVELCQSIKPDIVIMDINMPEKNGIEATEEITIRFPDIAVIIISVQDEPEYLRKSMNAGAKDYLTKPFNPLELVSNIRKIYSREMKKGKPKEDTASSESRKGKVVTFFSTKGGCGKTTLLINMAVTLKKYFPHLKIAVLDLKLQFGDVALMLNLNNALNIFDLSSQETTDFSQLESFFAMHESKISVLPCPDKPQYADSIDPDFVRRVISSCREIFDFTFIDTSSIIRENELCVLDETIEGLLFLVLTPEVTALRNTKETMNILQDLGFPLDNVRIILNRGEKNLVLTAEDIEKVLGAKINCVLPSEGEVTVLALNRGQPFAMTNENSRLSKALKDSAGVLFGLEVKHEEQGFLSKLKKIVR